MPSCTGQLISIIIGGGQKQRWFEKWLDIFMADIPMVAFKHNDLYAYNVLNPVTFGKLYTKEGVLSTFLFS